MEVIQSSPPTTQPKPGLCFDETETILYLQFKKKVLLDSGRCVRLLESILRLSNAFRNEILVKKNASKKFNKTSRIREEVNCLVNRSLVPDTFIDNLIKLIRTGKIESIETSLAEGKIVTVSAKTDFAKLLLGLKGITISEDTNETNIEVILTHFN